MSGLALAQAGLIVAAVLYFARELLIPLVIAVLLSFVLAPVARWLRRRGVARIAAVLVSVTLAVAMLVGIALVIGQQVSELAANLPSYRAAVAAKLHTVQEAGGALDRLTQVLRDLRHGGAAPELPQPRDVVAGPAPLPVEIRPPEASSLEAVRSVAEPLVQPLATAGIVIVLVIFILLYREDLRDRLIRLAGARDLHRTVAAMDDAAYRLSRFFLAQVALNSTVAVVMSLALWLIGIPNPVLWGFVSGLMRFVPFVGTFIAVAFPALLALAVDPGWGTLVWVLVLYATVEPLLGQVVEPLVFGQSTGLSPVAVIAAATFWTWLWGPVGLLLAVPLTVCLVVLGRHVQQLEFLEVILGDRPPLAPEEVFYQRALAGDSDGLSEQAERQLRVTGLAEYWDEVALPGLALAQADWARGALDPERLDGVRRQAEALMEELAEAEDEAPAAALIDEEREGALPDPPGPPPSEAWREPGAVLVLAGRGRFDELAASMLVQLLQARGFGAVAAAHDAVRSGGLERLDPGRVRLCCIAGLEGGSSAASLRYAYRRLRRRLPEAAYVFGLWQADPQAEALAALRAEAPDTPVATRLAEAVRRCREAATAAAKDAPIPAAG